MKKGYIISLFIIGLMLVATLSVGTGYGVWLSSKTQEETNTRRIDCFKVYYENDGIIELSKIKPVINSNGEETSPYTVTITNTCAQKKEVQVRLNTVKTTTIDVNALVLKTSGNIENNTILYKNLETTKTEEEDIKTSKLLGKVTIEPNETIRTNIRMWFDEKKIPNINEKTNYYKGHIEIIDSNQAIKPSIYETVLKDPEIVDKKEKPNYNEASLTDEGLYSVKVGNNKYYYYRGVVNNNYVKFANETWRIVGINPDKSIRLVLENSIGIRKYSNAHNYADYTGYKYVYNKVDKNNDITNILLSWYNSRLKELDKYIVNSRYCNDTSSTTTKNHTYYGAYTRLMDEDTSPTITCPATKVDFGGQYTQKIGLLTADEVVLAGANSNSNNYSFYLYNGEGFFTGSPSDFFQNNAYMIVVGNNGRLSKDKTDSEHGIRPVININGNLTFTGSGTKDNPYILDLE